MAIHLKPADSRRVPWKNGRGTTLDVASDAKRLDGPWTWRLSIADVPSSGAFSRYEGHDRFIACLEGDGMRLAFEGRIVTIPTEGEALRFSGDHETVGELIGGPCKDLNLIVRRDEWPDARLWLVRGAFERTDEPGATLVVHVIEGEAQVEETRGAGHDLAVGESLIVSDARTVTRTNGVVAVARMKRAK